MILTETLLSHSASVTVPITLVGRDDWSACESGLPAWGKAAADLAGFSGKSGQMALITSSEGTLAAVLCGLGGKEASLAAAARGLPPRLPAADYRIETPYDVADPAAIAVAWALGGYHFDRYRSASQKRRARLMVGPEVEMERIAGIVEACALTRDLINTPANDMGPQQLEDAARRLAEAHGCAMTAVVGAELLSAGYPAVHAVGRAASMERAPRMIEFAWGAPNHPRVVLVGKGVVFDSGGLDIKPSSGMRLMKKDMGGAAHVLGLARMIMNADLPIRLTVLLPVVENAISGDAMRPGDVLASRVGLSIEVGNTDAEGRLILADALTRASELDPDLTINMATLTGAARIALGPQVVPFYTPDDALAEALTEAALREEDPLWRMPLWAGYACALDSDIADIRNDADAWAQAGSVTAALFLQRFAPKGSWAHFDIFAWNPKARPGWPVGAEAQAVRAIFSLLEARYR